MKFSERLGYQPVRSQLQIEQVDDALKNSLWSVYLDGVIKALPNEDYKGYDLGAYVKSLWFNFFKLPIDRAPIDHKSYVFESQLLEHVRAFFFYNKNWYAPYDIIEFSAQYANHDFIPFVNRILEREKSGYRFIKGQLTQITSEVEIAEIEQAIDGTENIDSVRLHLTASLKYLSDKQNPVYRNSVKESISAVEALCKFYTGDEKATLGKALTKLEKAGSIPPAIKSAFSSLYGYTSDSSGIRHALTENDRAVSFHEAKFMLVTCTSFINYLLSKTS